MKPLVLIDFSNFSYACWFPALAAQKTDPKYDPHEVVKTNVIGKLGTLTRTLHEISDEKTDFKEATILFVEDRRSARKYRLWPQYKANRVPLEFDPRPEIKVFLLEKGYRNFAHSPDNEADDAIATLVEVADQIGQTVVVASSDKDLWQLKSPTCHIWQLTKDRFVTNEMITEEFGCVSAQQIPICKALWGDSGDNIPNPVPRMQKQLMPYVDDSASIDSFFGLLENFHVKSDRARELLAKGEKQVRLNWELVNLDRTCPIVLE